MPAQNKKKCTCSIEERMFTHRYCTPETEIAINLVNLVYKVHEVLHWPETEVYDSSSKTGGLS